MIKKLKLIILVLALCLTSIYIAPTDAKAQDSGEDIDFSFLLTEDALIGEMSLQTRGVYLSSGTSVINDSGNGKIGWGGATNAAKKCKVSMNAIVERKVNGSWVRVTSATTTNTNAYVAIVSKTLSVGSGYYYRCRGVHSAASDTAYSCTSSLWM